MEADGISKILARLDSLDAIAIEIKKLSNIEHTIQSMNNAMMEYKNDLQILSNELGEACEEIVVLKSRLDLAESENDRLKSKIDRLESKENSDVLLIFGLPEQKGEDCYKTAKDYFGSLSLGDLVLRSSYRRGKFNPAYKHPRPLVVKFLCEQDKTAVLKSQNKGRKGIYVKADLSPKAACVQAKKSAIRPIFKFLKTKNDNTVMMGDQIKFKGTNYSIRDLHKIPEDLKELGFLESESHVLFAGETCPLSNLYHCSIKCDGIDFNSAEQCFQYEKCLTRGRKDLAKDIMNVKTSREAMILSKNEQCPKDWTHNIGLPIMRKIVKLKFEQVEEFRQLIMQFKDKNFAEATFNRFWGIGVPFTRDMSVNPQDWQGENRLGEILSALANEQ